MADVEVLSEVFVRLVTAETGEDVFREESLVGLFTQQWAGSITDIGELTRIRSSPTPFSSLQDDVMMMIMMMLWRCDAQG